MLKRFILVPPTHQERERSSLLHLLLASNDRPSTEQDNLAHEIIKQAEKQLHDLDARLAEGFHGFSNGISKELTALKQQRRRILKSKCQYEGIISVMRRLPPEILQQIFIHAFPPYIYPDAPQYFAIYLEKRKDAIRYLWRLSHVCQSWRETALCMSPFWSFILRISPSSKLDCVNELIRRSGIIHLDVSVDFYEYSTLTSMPGLDVLITSCHRWGTAVLAMPTETLQSWIPYSQYIQKCTETSMSLFLWLSWKPAFKHSVTGIVVNSHSQYFQGAETAPLGDLSIVRSPEFRPRLTTLEIPIDKLAFASETLFPNVRALPVKYNSSLYLGTAPLPHDIRMPALEELNINTHDSASGETFHIPTWALSHAQP